MAPTRSRKTRLRLEKIPPLDIPAGSPLRHRRAILGLKMPFRALLHLIAFASLALSAAAQTVTGKVVGISDGDTLTIFTPARTQIKVRLDGIDAPEDGQDFSAASKRAREMACDIRSLSRNRERLPRTRTLDTRSRHLGVRSILSRSLS